LLSGLKEFQVTREVLESVHTQEVTHGGTSAFVTAFLEWNYQEGWIIACQIKKLVLYCHIHVVAFWVMAPHSQVTLTVFRGIYCLSLQGLKC